MALAYRDGWSHYAWHGVDVPEKIITSELTATDWLAETNTEVRWVIAERMGYARLLDVVNSTPEPDGSFRRYVLRVPPDHTVPRDAIGWTFGLPPG